MLFHKKVDEERGHSFAPERQSFAASTPVHQAPLAQRKPEGLAPRAVIDAGLSIIGCLQTEGEVQIDGQINGDIRCAHLLVGKSGTIVGDISADEVVIRGKVKGAIRAGRVIIQESAHVESDISHDKLAIEEGAYFKGTSTHNDPKEIEVPEPHVAALREVADDMKAIAQPGRGAILLEDALPAIGGIAHDFNNILTIIVGNSGLLANGVADRSQLAALATMVDEAASTRSLIHVSEHVAK